ncbi:MAG: hypothetical protein JNG88_03505 [Phycisphaerales bacterium]|nr:hypothetical protein [Phycisphaerales bacterium]
MRVNTREERDAVLGQLPEQLNNPIAQRIILVGGAIIAFFVISGIWRKIKNGFASRERQAELKRTLNDVAAKQEEAARLAGRIIATSSTGQIVGFEIVQQIEAVFTDGHPAPAKAAESLKAEAATRGANAIINMNDVRLPNGKCSARGDAVIVRAITPKP